jgi:hypothetical protein
MNIAPRTPPTHIVAALAALLVLVSRAYAPAQLVYSGVWHPGSDAHAAWVTADWEDFTETWDDFNEGGLRMDDFEVFIEGGTPVYAGLFRQGTGGHAAWVTADWADFTSKWTEFGNANLRMHDFETYEVGGTRWYAGIFRQGTDFHAAHIVADWTDFTNTWNGFNRSGLRMHDFETYEIAGVRWFAGIFREGTDGNAAWFTDDWNSFTDTWADLEEAGLRLVDFEFFDNSGTWTYGGIYRQGTGGHLGWFGVDWQNFTSFWHQAGKDGWRLDDIEAFPSACSNTCMNQVILPAPDWYDYGITRTADHCPGLPGTCSVPGDPVYYRAPFYEDGGQRYVRLSAVNIEHAIFTLPFGDTDMKHNGWLYSPGSWHHAVDYYNGTNFDVLAAAPGEVIHVGWDTWSGGTVVLSHDAGGEEDVYRTIYMHLLNGADADCNRSWMQTVPTLSGSNLNNFKDYLVDTGCNQDGSGTPNSTWWGTNSTTVPVSVGDFVARGEKIGQAGSTGPGGCGCAGGGSGPNHHLHIFFAHRDPTDDRWYFFDPYGIYGPSECYPTRDDADSDPPETPCARYPVAWLGGRPRLPGPVSEIKSFKRGDSNGDLKLDISDAVFQLGCSFLGTRCPECDDAADSNDDGEINITDAIYTLTCLFGRACEDVQGSCVRDSSSDRLGCRGYDGCTPTRG